MPRKKRKRDEKKPLFFTESPARVSCPYCSPVRGVCNPVTARCCTITPGDGFSWVSPQFDTSHVSPKKKRLHYQTNKENIHTCSYHGRYKSLIFNKKGLTFSSDRSFFNFFCENTINNETLAKGTNAKIDKSVDTIEKPVAVPLLRKSFHKLNQDSNITQLLFGNIFNTPIVSIKSNARILVKDTPEEQYDWKFHKRHLHSILCKVKLVDRLM